jgi:hypothetical protein
VSARREPVLRPEFGPSLPELLRARWGVAPRVTAGLAVLVVLAGLALVVLSRGNEIHLVHRDPEPVFNLRYANVLKQLPERPGVLLALEGRRGDLFLQSMVVRPLRLPAYRGAVSGLLPIFATRRMRTVARDYSGFLAVDEGKARINDAPGYQVGFRARIGGRTVYGREIVLVPDEPGARDGVTLTLLQTNAAGAHSVEDVGAVGALKKPFRSFRFGTEAK